MSDRLDKLLLLQLADGALHSGQALGAALGVSRAAVWKRLQALTERGLMLEQVRGHGYRLRHGMQLLDEQVIGKKLVEPLSIEVHDEIASTSDLAMERARAGQRAPLAVLAESQTAGRGRLGRQWQSPLGHNLYLTLLWPFAAGTRLQGLSLVVGLVVAEMLDRMGLANVGLKWPNDIHARRHKLGGILVELAGDLELDPVAIIGIGINGWLGDALIRDINQPVTDWLTETGQALDRNQLAGALLGTLQLILPVFAAEGFAAFRARWQLYDLCAGQDVWLLQGEQRTLVSALGVAEDGSLRVMNAGVEQRVYGGEVSVRWQ